MKLLTREEMQGMDRRAIERLGIPSLTLMENAGRGVAEVIQKEFPFSQCRTVSFICGKGNNGGDGFVAARYLRKAGYEVKVFILVPEEDYRGDALVNLNRLSLKYFPLHNEHALRLYQEEIKKSSLLVDAIFGTGLDRSVQGFAAKLIRFLNTTRRPIVAVDIPSGLCANTGRVMGEAIRAALTCTLHLPKRGLVFGPDSSLAGPIQVTPIGIPEDLAHSIRRKEYLITPELFRDVFKPRKRESHKGTFGHVLTVAGSRRKIGAALMTARSALRAGAGLSTLALPECAYKKIDPKFAVVMFEPQNDDGEFFSNSALSSILRLASTKSVLACGPGLGVSEDLQKLIAGIIRGVRIPCVLDADALNCLSMNLKPLRDRHPPLVLTPHPGEMARLAGKSNDEILAHRAEIAIRFAKRYRIYLVLKGYRSLVATPEGELFVNSTGNPGMATGGAGDVLTGILSGLIAQGIPLLQAVLAGVWIHGRAGDLVAKKKGEAGMIAWDIAEEVPCVMREIFNV
jgi:hydroxyethylthiazole kinase-like uncharacterized protein yjeF